jgi:hypothetical protein
MPVLDISPNINSQAAGVLQFFRDGQDPASQGFTVDSSGVITATSATFSGTVTAAGITATGPAAYTGATAATDVIRAKVTGDANQRFIVDADGTLNWGDGTAVQDVNLYRYAANGLATDDAFKLAAAAILLLGAAGDVNLYRSAGGTLATDNDLTLAVAGKGLQVKEGSNAKMGTATLVAGTKVVSTTAVTATSRVFLTAQSVGGTAGALAVTARTAGTSFTITSTSGTDTSTVAWLIVEPSA